MKSLAMAMAMAAAILLQLCSSMVEETISKLPGQPEVSFQQFSGYITVDKMKQRALFYYFVEAELDPSTKPVVLWLNGGKDPNFDALCSKLVDFEENLTWLFNGTV